MERTKEKKLEKIVVNIGLGKLRDKPHFEDKILPEIVKEISIITGQKPSIVPAKKSIAGFKVREGEVVGLKTTLRGKRMIDFFSKIINTTLPRVRDFRGLNKSIVDHSGSLNIGFKDKQVFPEVDSDKSKIDFGLQVTVVPKERDRDDALEIYKEMGVPFKKEE
ncbi:MAG: 50S ribosomal protein L5 [Candidatus Paceibacterota bacterium]